MPDVPALQPLPRKEGEPLRDYALRVLRHNIVSLRMEPGRMYSEKELSDALSLSRTPMRDAIQQLSHTGIVEIYPQRGTAVALIDYDLVEEARFIREALECAVVRLLCRKIAPEELSELESNIHRQKRCLMLNNLSGLMTLDLRFHELLFRFAGKLQCHEYVVNMTIHMDRVRSMALKAQKTHPFVQQHEALLDAIRAGDGETASRLMSQHVSGYLVDRDALCQMYPQYVKNA